MRLKLLSVTGTVWVGLILSAKAASVQCPSGAIAFVESVSTSATRYKCGFVGDLECETSVCLTRRYQTMKTVNKDRYATKDGAISVSRDLTHKYKAQSATRAPGGDCDMQNTSTGTFSAHFLDGLDLPDCSGMAYSMPPLVSGCPTYTAAVGYLYLAHMTAVTLPPSCPKKSMTQDVDASTRWTGSTTETTISYEDPITDSVLMFAVQGAIPTPTDPGSNSGWAPGASSSIGRSVVDGEVTAGGSKSLYRFRVLGAQGGVDFEIRWEVWDEDAEGGIRLFKSEKTSFKGAGIKVQYVDGRILDLPDLGVDECQTGSVKRYVIPETIRVVVQESDNEGSTP